MTDHPPRLVLKEIEALMWGLGQIVNDPKRVPGDVTDPLAVLLAEGLSRKTIMQTGERLFDKVDKDMLDRRFSPTEQSILRASVENSSWITAYVLNGPAGGTDRDCRKTLRALASKLEQVGVEINHLPND